MNSGAKIFVRGELTLEKAEFKQMEIMKYSTPIWEQAWFYKGKSVGKRQPLNIWEFC